MCQPLSALSLALLSPLEESGRLGGTDGPDLTRYFLVCAILLVVTGLVAWGFRRLVSGDLKLRAGKRSLSVIDVLPLGGKRRLAVVRCYDRTFVLGLGDREVSAIAELDPVVAPGREKAPSAADRAAFAQALQQVRPALPPGARPASEAVGPPEREPRRKVKKKVRHRRPAGAESESIAQAARRLASEKRAVAPQPEPPETPSIPRLEGLLG